MGSALGCVRSREDVEDNKKPGNGRLLQQKTSQGAKVVRAGWPGAVQTLWAAERSPC